MDETEGKNDKIVRFNFILLPCPNNIFNTV